MEVGLNVVRLLPVKHKTAVTFSGQCTSTSRASPDRSLHITSRKLTKVTGGILLTHRNSGFSSILSRSVAPARIFFLAVTLFLKDPEVKDKR